MGGEDAKIPKQLGGEFGGLAEATLSNFESSLSFLGMFYTVQVMNHEASSDDHVRSHEPRYGVLVSTRYFIPY